MDDTSVGFGGGFGLIILILLFIFAFGGNGMFGGSAGSATEVYSRLASESGKDVISQGYENQIATMRGSYESLLQFKDVQAQMAACCCDLKSTVIEQSQMTRDLINSNTITELRAQLVEERDANITAAQTASLLNVLAPRPVPETVPAYYGYPIY